MYNPSSRYPVIFFLIIATIVISWVVWNNYLHVQDPLEQEFVVEQSNTNTIDMIVKYDSFEGNIPDSAFLDHLGKHAPSWFTNQGEKDSLIIALIEQYELFTKTYSDSLAEECPNEKLYKYIQYIFDNLHGKIEAVRYYSKIAKQTPKYTYVHYHLKFGPFLPEENLFKNVKPPYKIANE